MLKLFKVILLLFYSFNGLAIDLIHSPIGETRIDFKPQDYKIIIKKYANDNIKSIVDSQSLEWIRFNETLLVPRVRVKIRIKKTKFHKTINYKERSYNFQESQNYSYAELYYSLYEQKPIVITDQEKKVAEISIEIKPRKKNTLLVDYTCSRNQIEIKGIENEYLSIGCITRRIGNFGKEKPMLEVSWISPDLKVLNAQDPPYYSAFLNNLPIKVEVLNIKTKKIKTLEIFAKIPKRLHRLFTAYGFGPYSLHTKILKDQEVIKQKKVDIAPALFLYANYKISETTSIRGFNAAMFQESVFDNAGMYLGSDFGFSLDNRFYMTTLLGVQYLYFQFDKDSSQISEAIFPQGLEFMYRHAFDIPNYIISGGFFVSTSETIDYENVWLRWGKNYFWELNLISWGKDEFQATTWGLSVGFPFKGFL